MSFRSLHGLARKRCPRSVTVDGNANGNSGGEADSRVVAVFNHGRAEFLHGHARADVLLSDRRVGGDKVGPRIEDSSRQEAGVMTASVQNGGCDHELECAK